MNDELREMTLRRVSAEELRKAAERSGLRSMYDDGILKVKMGLTTLDEVIGVTGQEE